MERFTSIGAAEPFTTLDGSTVREIAHPSATDATNQSLAEASLPPGGATDEHHHRTSEELYLVTEGNARVRVADDERDLVAGDCVVIPPGTPHKVFNPGERTLRFLCCCAPAYSDEDTVVTEPR